MNEPEQLPCADKMVFDSKEEAAAAALAVDWQRGTPLRPYKCRHCHLWHLTTSAPD